MARGPRAAPGIMTARGALIALHWATFLLMLVLIKGGTRAEILRWSFVLVTAAWLVLTLAKGLQARPGPKLQGVLRRSFRALHWGMLGLVGLTCVLNLTALLQLTPLVWAWNALLLLLTAATFHGLFHLWRHTALYDGALRMMTPRGWHRHL